jgi:hemolysin activation/secretion protein
MPKGEGSWTPARSLSIGVAVAQRRSRSFLLGEPFSFAPGSVNGRSKYTAARLLGDLLVRSVNQVFAASVTATLGLEGTRSPVPEALNPDENFKALLVQLNYARRLNTKGLELRARATGQVSDSILYSGERLSSGGESTIRGYRENLLLTDKGLIGSVELSQRFSLSGGDRSGFDWGGFAVAGFLDGARLYNAGRAMTPTSSLYSVGASLSWVPSDAILAKFSYGHALKDVGNTGKEDLQDRGIHFGITLYPLRLLR